MSKYESVVITKPKEEIGKRIIKEIGEYIKTQRELEKVEELGIKRLAYTVKENDSGYYIIFDFNSEGMFISELENKYRQDEDILKFMTIRTSED